MSGEDSNGFHGNAIMAKYTLQDSFVMRLDRPIDQWYRGEYSHDQSERRLGGRMALISEIQAGPSTVHLVSVHLECKLSNHEQDAAQLCDKFQAIGANKVILGGDTC